MGGCLLFNQFVLAIYTVRNEGLGFWALGRVFNDELLMLLPIYKTNRAGIGRKLILTGRALLIIVVLLTFYMIYLIKSSEF